MYDNDLTLTEFGLVFLKKEGAPLHPDEFVWEHPPNTGCEKCTRRYNKALDRYNKYLNEE